MENELLDNARNLKGVLPIFDIDRVFSVRKSNGRAKVVSNTNFEKNIHIAYIDSGEITPPTFQTVQIGVRNHLLERVLLAMNHSCDPNVYIDTKNMLITSLKLIHMGDEINFFYPSTEWSMSEPFNCRCGSENCLKYISGASGILCHQTIDSYKLNDHIMTAFQQLLCQDV